MFHCFQDHETRGIATCTHLYAPVPVRMYVHEKMLKVEKKGNETKRQKYKTEGEISDG